MGEGEIDGDGGCESQEVVRVGGGEEVGVKTVGSPPDWWATVARAVRSSAGVLGWGGVEHGVGEDGAAVGVEHDVGGRDAAVGKAGAVEVVEGLASGLGG